MNIGNIRGCSRRARHGQFGQLPLGENPTEEKKEPEEIDLSDRCWKDEDGVWMTGATAQVFTGTLEPAFLAALA